MSCSSKSRDITTQTSGEIYDNCFEVFMSHIFQEEKSISNTRDMEQYLKLLILQGITYQQRHLLIECWQVIHVALSYGWAEPFFKVRTLYVWRSVSEPLQVLTFELLTHINHHGINVKRFGIVRCAQSTNQNLQETGYRLRLQTP